MTSITGILINFSVFSFHKNRLYNIFEMLAANGNKLNSRILLQNVSQ